MISKIKNFINKNLQIILALLGATIVIYTVYYLQSVAPFGNNSLLTIDFFHQYGPMLGELYDRIKGFSSVIYSFNMGMGLPFYRNFFNYLSSPFNIIMFLFEHRELLTSYSVIIAAKATASAVTMTYYLKKKFNTKSLLLVPLGILYAFCAYFTAYYWNIMWLDGMVLLPLITLGIENIINKGKCKLYIFSLALMLFSSYFIGYMICIFSVIYFISYLIIKTDKFDWKLIFKKCLLFGGSSLLAGGLCAIALIPMYYGLSSISATSDAFPTSQYYAFTLKEFLFNHFSGIGSTVLKSGITCAPNVSCGVLSIVLFLLFIINPKIKVKTKIVYFLILAFLAVSFIVAPLDFIWHGFHVPNDLPYRYSFLYSFILTIISAYSILNIKYLKPILISIVYIITMGLITAIKYLEYTNINADMIILNYILITVFYLLYIIYAYFSKYKKYIAYVLIITNILECIIVINNNWFISLDIPIFYNEYNAIEKANNFIKDNDSEMYRIEKSSFHTLNDSSWYNYYGYTTFSSMEYENMAVLQHYLGLPGNEINSYYYKQTTPVFDLMFNIKYIFGLPIDESKYILYYDNDTPETTVHKNKYNLGLLFGVNSKLNEWDYTLENPFSIQNDFITKATGIDKVLQKVPTTKKEEVLNNGNTIIMKYKVDSNQNNYLYMNSDNIDFLIVDNKLYYNNDSYENIKDYLNTLNITDYIDYNEKHIINTAVNEYYVGYNNYYADNILVYSLDNKKFEQAYNYLLNKKAYIASFTESNIKATYEAEENEMIYTSIPYDEGWDVYIDGEKVETKSLGNALLAYDITKGKHEIEIIYHIPKIMLGSIISIISLLIIFFPKKSKKRMIN